jgi:hypothetical protein
MGPSSKTIMEGSKERQGDFVFTANDEGEYRFCFNNEMSTFADKLVDFEIAVRPLFSCLIFQFLPFPSPLINSILPPQPLHSDQASKKAKESSQKLTAPWSRSRMKREPPSPRNKAHRRSRRRPSKNPSSSSLASYRPSTATRSISEPERTAISAPYAAPSVASSI